ncbi:MAG: hypothetical protein VYA30_14570, partial [Myxococcota bacterium]|nr:hypothetical protein [Myxococcota bacterium]
MALKSRGRMAHLGSLTGVVSNVGSTIVQLPARLWRHPRIPEYGRAIHVLLDENRLLPGEVVSAEPRPGTRPTPPVPAPLANTAGQVEPPQGSEPPKSTTDPAASETPQPVQVPDDLRTKTRMEISGAVYLPDLGETLVISDDTGIGGPHEDVPWVFWLDEKGILSSEPSAVAGIQAVSDLEAVA